MWFLLTSWFLAVLAYLKPCFVLFSIILSHLVALEHNRKSDCRSDISSLDNENVLLLNICADLESVYLLSISEKSPIYDQPLKICALLYGVSWLLFNDSLVVNMLMLSQDKWLNAVRSGQQLMYRSIWACAVTLWPQIHSLLVCVYVCLPFSSEVASQERIQIIMSSSFSWHVKP